MMDVITNEINTRSVYYRRDDVVQHFAVGRTYEIRIRLCIFSISVFSCIINKKKGTLKFGSRDLHGKRPLLNHG